MDESLGSEVGNNPRIDLLQNIISDLKNVIWEKECALAKQRDSVEKLQKQVNTCIPSPVHANSARSKTFNQSSGPRLSRLRRLKRSSTLRPVPKNLTFKKRNNRCAAAFGRF